MYVFDSYVLILFKSIVSPSIQEDLQASFLANLAVEVVIDCLNLWHHK